MCSLSLSQAEQYTGCLKEHYNVFWCFISGKRKAKIRVLILLEKQDPPIRFDDRMASERCTSIAEICAKSIGISNH